MKAFISAAIGRALEYFTAFFEAFPSGLSLPDGIASWEAENGAKLGGRAQAVMRTMGSSCKYR